MKTARMLRNFLLFLLGFLSAGAFYGGIGLIIKPDGSLFQMPVSLLEGSVFSSFFVPGIILMIMFGILPVLSIIGLIRRPDYMLLRRINLLSDHHPAWTFSIYIGFGLIIWINVQTLIFNSVAIIHTVYSSLGILIVCVALLPPLRNSYRISPPDVKQ